MRTLMIFEEKREDESEIVEVRRTNLCPFLFCFWEE